MAEGQVQEDNLLERAYFQGGSAVATSWHLSFFFDIVHVFKHN